MRLLSAACAAAFLLVGACSSVTDSSGGLPVNTDFSREWPEASPDEQGIDQAKLDIAFNVASGRPFLRSLLIVRNGYLVTEKYFGTSDDTTVTNIYAVTTSILSALVGIAVADGDIQSVDQPISDFLVPAAIPSLDAAHRAITIRHLLTMTSGLQWAEGSKAESDGFAASPYSTLWEYTLSKPFAETPGNRINYNSGAASLLSVVLTHATGKSTFDFARQALLTPLGIDSVGWVKDGSTYWYGGSAMRMRPRDMAKLGALFVNGGRSAGHQLVPADWIARSLTPIVANGIPYVYGAVQSMNYGFMWWIDRAPDREAFFAWGYGGQFVYCVPALKLVIVTTTDASTLSNDTRTAVEKDLLTLIIDRIIPAVH